MSSLAAARADNFYYPPEWTPSQGGINKFQKSHPLGKRARKIDEGILVIRFEMPFNVWCEGCETHIGKGVRYNAEKKKAGKFFTTTIWEFSMRCAECKNLMVIQTDPENRNYKLVSGVRKKHEEFEAASAETIELKDEGTAQKLAQDPFFRLEHAEVDKAKAAAGSKAIQDLMAIQDGQKDDFSANQRLRSTLRAKKKEAAAKAKEAAARNLYIPLLDPISADSDAAKRVKFYQGSAKDKASRKRNTIANESIFGTSSKPNKGLFALSLQQVRPSSSSSSRLPSSRKPSPHVTVTRKRK